MLFTASLRLPSMFNAAAQRISCYCTANTKTNVFSLNSCPQPTTHLHLAMLYHAYLCEVHRCMRIHVTAPTHAEDTTCVYRGLSEGID